MAEESSARLFKLLPSGREQSWIRRTSPSGLGRAPRALMKCGLLLVVIYLPSSISRRICFSTLARFSAFVADGWFLESMGLVGVALFIMLNPCLIPFRRKCLSGSFSSSFTQTSRLREGEETGGLGREQESTFLDAPVEDGRHRNPDGCICAGNGTEHQNGNDRC